VETLRIAAAALRRNKLRSFLTLLGVIIGVMTVVAVVAIVNGLNAYVTEQVFSLNPDVFVITQFGIITSQEEFFEALKRKRITLADAAAVERLCRGCAEVGVGNNTNQVLKVGPHRLADVTVLGGTANMASLNNIDLEAGRSYLESEDEHAAPVAVIGAGVREELFGRLDPIGRLVWIEGAPYKVIGVVKKQGSVLGQNQDNRAYIPLGAYRKQFGLRRSVVIFARPTTGMDGLEAAMDEVRSILRTRRGTPFRAKDPFGIVTAGAVGDVWRQISGAAFALVTFISGISLLVGGIVIANIMLVSVIERTREIGIRRALGARRRDILLQFLSEAVMLSLAGGILGVGLGWAIARGLSAAFPLPTRVTPGLVLAGLLIAIVTGLLAGVFPARKAARLPPIDALRYE
jgi:putative ABC transport system permease protein